jgi:hypothetical protein
MLRNSLVPIFLSLAVSLNAQEVGNAAHPEASIKLNSQSQEFRSALAVVMHARFASFSELKTGASIFQLPGMSCSLLHRDNITSYLCSAQTSSPAEADRLYGSLASAVAIPLHGYPLCQKPTVADGVGLTSFCHYPKMLITDASVQSSKGAVSLEVFGREAGDRGEPAQFLHAYALAGLGRHAEAVGAFESILGPSVNRDVYDQERHAYDVALKWTQDCIGQRSCMAEDFLAIGKNKEALHWQNQLFKNFRQGEKVNLRQGEELDPASAKSVVLADAYDLNARIEAAMGQLGSALRDLDSAVDALPKNSKAAPREAAYYYHRALIFAVNLKFNEAAKACRKSFSAEDSGSADGGRREPQCLEIYALASPPVSDGVN